MSKRSILSFVFIALFLLTLVIVPFLGVDYYDPISSSILNINFPSLSLNGGTRLKLTFDDDSLELLEEDYKKAAETIKKRFDYLGYGDTVVTVQDDNSLLIDVALKKYVKDGVQSLTSAGKWTFTDLYQGDPISVSTSDIKNAVPFSSNGSSYVRIEFTSEGAEKFDNQVQTVIKSGTPYLTFMIDEGNTAYSFVYLSEYYSKPYLVIQVSDPATVSTFLLNDSLPSSMTAETVEELAPTLAVGLRILIYFICALACAALCAVLIIKAKISGLFASLAIAGNALVFLTAIANYQLSTTVQSLAFIGITLLLIWGFYFYVSMRIGAELKKGKSLSTVFENVINRLIVPTLIIHGTVIFISLILTWYFSGAFANFVNTLYWGAIANVVLFFMIYYLGVKAAAEAKQD